eukprot:m.157817 g.157817  ORF g.157817 m.157817 type:complete len:145 (+) comp31067_c2_seq4:269-703(+)
MPPPPPPPPPTVPVRLIPDVDPRRVNVELTTHQDGSAMGAPKPTQREVVHLKANLKETGVNKEHTGVVSKDASGTVTHTGLYEFKLEREELVALFCDNDGDLDQLAVVVPAKFGAISLAKLQAHAPTTAKQFAWQCAEGYYFAD